MIRQNRDIFRALVIGMSLLFSGTSMVGLVGAQVSEEESKVQFPDAHQHDAASMGKRQGQSPSNKRVTKKTESGAVEKRKGQSPANKPTPRDIPSVDERQGQSPSEKGMDLQ